MPNTRAGDARGEGPNCASSFFDQLNATILRFAVFGRVVGHRLRIPQSYGGEARAIHAMLLEPSHNSGGMLLGLRFVGLFTQDDKASFEAATPSPTHSLPRTVLTILADNHVTADRSPAEQSAA